MTSTPHVYMGAGPTSARIMVVGEFWSPDDEVTKAPFSGADGRELERMLLEAGIRRSEVYTTCAVNARPPYNDVEKWLPVKRSDIRSNMVKMHGKQVDPIVVAGWKSLAKEIELIKPQVIICMGNLALWALTGEWGALKWRGSMLRHGEAHLIPTLTARQVMGNWEWRADVVQDLKRAYLQSTAPVQPPDWRITVRPSFRDAHSSLSALLARLSTETLWIECDLETRAGHIACCGLSWSATEAISIPFMCVENRDGYWMLEEEAALIYQLYQILTHPNARIRGQNFAYDMQYIHRHWHFLPRCDQDTMLSQHTLFAGRRKALDYQASLYCSHYVYWKDDGKTWTKDVDENQLWRYNGIDCLRTREVGEVETSAINQLSLNSVEAFQQRFLLTVVRTMLRGVRIDLEERKRFARILEVEIEKRSLFFSRILGHTINPKSPTQMKKLFYDDLKQPVMYKRAKGGAFPSITLDDNALVKIRDREPILRPLVKGIQEYRSLGVFLSTFVRAPLDNDGRMRCSYNVAGTETYRLSSSENAFGSGCFPPGAEVLTPEGWIPMESVLEGTVVMQYCPVKAQAEWVPAKPYKTAFSGLLCHAATEQYKTTVTPGHRILATKAGRADWKEYHAGNLSKYSSQYKIPVAGLLKDGNVCVEYPRLLAAALADGSYEDGRVRFGLRKKRKCERLQFLCDLYGVELKETYSGREGYRRFWFRKPDSWPMEKTWDWTFLDFTEDTRESLIDESRYWDSHVRGESFIFYTASKKVAEVYSTMCHLTGRSTTIRITEQSENSYSDTLMYCVNVKPRSLISVEGHHWSEIPYIGDVYCISVPSTYFLVRQHGHISVTGNTNLQNIPKGSKAKDPDELSLPNIRSLFIPDEGFEFFDMDLDRADLQVVVWEADDVDLKLVLRKGIDMHLFNACDIFNIKGIPPEELIETHPNYTDHRGRITEGRRQLAKAGCHAVNYFCQARTLATHLGGTVHEAQQFINSWLGAHPGIKLWHERTEEQLTKRRYVENAFGYRRYYFDRLEGLLPQALAWTPQSTVACVINRAWVNIDEHLPECQVLLQVHDSLAGQYPLHQRDMVLSRMKELSHIVIPYPDPLIIPVGIKTSPRSWGDCK